MSKKLKTAKDVKKFLNEVAAEDRVNSITEKDIEFLKSIGIDTDLETFKKLSIEACIKKHKK